MPTYGDMHDMELNIVKHLSTLRNRAPIFVGHMRSNEAGIILF